MASDTAAGLIVKTFPVGPLGCNCTILGDPASGEAIVIDPGGDAPRVLALLAEHGLRCTAVLNTHTHFDHVGANPELKDLGAAVMLHEEDMPLYEHLALQAELFRITPPPRAVEVDDFLHQGDRVRAGSIVLDVLHTPGHTPGSLCFHHEPSGLLLSGDTLFAGSIGRTDLWGGDYDQEITSIRTRLFPLPAATRVVPGHGDATTLARERAANPFLAGL